MTADRDHSPQLGITRNLAFQTDDLDVLVSLGSSLNDVLFGGRSVRLYDRDRVEVSQGFHDRSSEEIEEASHE